MTSKLCASWLVLLILAPFTALFATCDLATLFGSAAHHSATLAVGTSAVLALAQTLSAQTIAALSLGPSSAIKRKQIRLLARARLNIPRLAIFSMALHYPVISTAYVDTPPTLAPNLRL